jgi:hypothetical protein
LSNGLVAKESCEKIVDFEGSGVDVAARRYLPILGSPHRRGKTRTQTSRKLGKGGPIVAAT